MSNQHVIISPLFGTYPPLGPSLFRTGNMDQTWPQHPARGWMPRRCKVAADVQGLGASPSPPSPPLRPLRPLRPLPCLSLPGPPNILLCPRAPVGGPQGQRRHSSRRPQHSPTRCLAGLMGQAAGADAVQELILTPEIHKSKAAGCCRRWSSMPRTPARRVRSPRLLGTEEEIARCSSGNSEILMTILSRSVWITTYSCEAEAPGKTPARRAWHAAGAAWGSSGPLRVRCLLEVEHSH